MKHPYIDPSTQRKGTIISNKLVYMDNFPLFTLVEINIYGACNRHCSFCPVSKPEFFTNKYEGIKKELYLKLLHDLQSIGYQGTILFSAFSEPLLYENICDLVAYSKEFLPHAHIEIVSNGDMLLKSPHLWNSLFNAGLDMMNVSIYDGPKEYDIFKQIIDEKQLPLDKISLRRRYFNDGNFGLTVSNRGGIIDSNKYRGKQEQGVDLLPLNKNCYYPFYQMLIDYNGDMSLCPHDWKKNLVVGNISENHIWDLWISDTFEKARLQLSKNNRDFLPCRFCDVLGDVMGVENYNAWRMRK